MCVQEATLISQDLAELKACEEQGRPVPFRSMGMGNPMHVGSISRQCWASQQAHNTWEAFVVDQEDSSDGGDEISDASSADEEFWESYFGLVGPLVEDGGGAWVGMTGVDHAEWAKSCPHPSENLEATENMPERFMDICF